MKNSIICPFCKKDIPLRTMALSLVYREVNYVITEYHYECDKCEERFTTSESNKATLSQIPNQDIWK